MAHPRLLKRGSVYYFRARIPKDLVPIFGKAEVRYSLRTRDYHEACRLVRQASADFDRECEAHRTRLRQHERPPRREPLDDSLIREVCEAWRIATLEGDELSRQQGLYRGAAHAEHLAEREACLNVLKTAYAQGDLMAIKQALHTFLNLFLHLAPVGGQEDWERLYMAFLTTVLETHQQVLRRDRGEVVHTPTADALRRLAPQVPPEAERVSLNRLFEAWKRFDPNRAPATVEAVRKTQRDFQRYIGESDARKIRREDIIRYRDHLIEQGKQPRTVAKHLGFICSLFNTGINNGLLDSNPAQRVPMPRDRHAKRRQPFSLEDLQALFSSPVYTEGAAMGRLYRDSAVWLPLIALYHGCRLEEIAQLQIDDIEQIDGLPCLRIDDYSERGESDKRLKTASSRRILPIHPELVRLGFLRYVARIQAQGGVWLFPELKPGRNEKRGAAFSRGFMRYLRNRLRITDPRKVFHSFRHNFRGACREAGLDEEISDALMGHSGQGRMGRNYGAGFSVRRLHQAISRIRYPGLEIPVQIPEDSAEGLSRVA